MQRRLRLVHSDEMDVAAEGRKEQICQKDIDEKESDKRARTEYAQRARIGAIVTVDEPKPVVDVEPTDESSCLDSVLECIRNGRQEGFANMNGVGVLKNCVYHCRQLITIMPDGQQYDVWRAGVWRGRWVGRENGAWIHNETMFTRQVLETKQRASLILWPRSVS